jgi:hypothetical protein
MLCSGLRFYWHGRLWFLAVYFLTFILLVGTAVDCHLSFDPLGKSAPLDTLHYVQPRCPPAVYPSESSPALFMAAPSPAHPAIIEDDNNKDALLGTPLAQPEAPPLPASSLPLPGLDMATLSTHLKILANVVDKLSSNHPLLSCISHLLASMSLLYRFWLMIMGRIPMTFLCHVSSQPYHKRRLRATSITQAPPSLRSGPAILLMHPT